MNLKNQKGGSLVEFAIISPLLFVILFGIIEFGILIYDKAMITNASREGARAGIVFDFANAPARISDIEIRTRVKEYCQDHLISFGSGSSFGDGNITITPPGDRSGMPAGSNLTVTVSYPFRFLVFSNVLALIGGDVADLVNLSAVTVMRLE